jgi:hypothetical protein
MSEKEALIKFGEYLKANPKLPLCVPLSLQFVLPDNINIPSILYQRAIKEDGLLPSDALNVLKDEKLITFTAYSLTQEEANRYFTEHIKYMVNDRSVMGIAFSQEPEVDNHHFVTVKKPLVYNNQIKVFDTTHKNPIYWTNIDRLISNSTPCSIYGRHNVWFIYSGSKCLNQTAEL